jgi:hypothetical protein
MSWSVSPTQAWHERKPNSEQIHRFERLKDFHSLIRALVQAVSHAKTQPTYTLPRFTALEGQDPLSLVQKLSQATVIPDLESLLQDLSPEEGLKRLEHSLWLALSWTLQEFKSQSSDWATMGNALQQAAWKAGRACGLLRWPTPPKDAQEDLRSLISALECSPVSGASLHPGFVLMRHTPSKAQVAWVGCPHQSPWAEVRAQGDPICDLMSHWLRGWIYALNPKPQANYVPRPTDADFCQLHWEI